MTQIVMPGCIVDADGALPRFVALLQRGVIGASAAPDIALAVWKKLVINCAFNACARWPS